MPEQPKQHWSRLVKNLTLMLPAPTTGEMSDDVDDAGDRLNLW